MNKDSATGELKSNYHLRSSLKKSFRNPIGSLDVSDEGQDITMAPPPRRVSFAASSTVKPFANDPEKNTIWDNTYEEEINNFTDSNNVISLDSHTNLQEARGITQGNSLNVNFNQTIGDLEATLCNSSESSMEITSCNNVHIDNPYGHSKSVVDNNMELTCQWKNNIVDGCKTFENKSVMSSNCTQYQEMDMSLTGYGLNIADKENIQTPSCFTTVIKKTHTDLTSRIRKKKSIKPVKPFGNNSLLMKTITQPSDMELTCQFDTKKVNFSKQLENMPQDYEPMEVDEISKTTHYTNQTVYQEVDMSITCKFNSHVIDNENIFAPEKVSGGIVICGKSNNMELANSNQAAADMEFNHEKVMESQQKIHTSNSISSCPKVESSHINIPASNMESTHHISQTDVNIPPTHRIQKASFSVYQNNSSLNPNQSAADMEFTCRFRDTVAESQISTVQAVSSESNQKVGFPSSSKTDKATVDMEFTCRFPEKAVESQISTVQALNSDSTQKVGFPTSPKRDKSTVDMEFSCRFPKRVVRSQTSTIQAFHSDSTEKVGVPFSSKGDASTVDMEFTCRFPEKAVGSQISTIRAFNSETTQKVGFPTSSINDKSTVDMEFTCRFPEKAVGSQISAIQAFNSDATKKVDFLTSSKKHKSAVDMEFTCRFPEKDVEPQISTVHGFNSESAQKVGLPASSKSDKSMADMEFTCRFPEKAVESQISTVQGLNSESAQKVGFPLSSKSDKSMADMEFTCRFPEKAVESQISTVQGLNSESAQKVGFPLSSKRDKSMADMDFTCGFPEKPVDSQISRIQAFNSDSGQKIGFPTSSKREKSTADMEFSHFPDKVAESQKSTLQVFSSDSTETISVPTSKEYQPTADMEFTNRFPEEAAEESQKIPVQALNSDITQKVSFAAFLGENQSNVYQSEVSQESKSQLPQSAVGSQRDSQTYYTNIIHKPNPPITAVLEKTFQSCHSITQQASFSSCVKEEELTATQTDMTHKENTSTYPIANDKVLKCNFPDQSNCSRDLTHVPNKTIGTEHNSRNRRALIGFRNCLAQPELEEASGISNMVNNAQSFRQETTSVPFSKAQVHTEKATFNTRGECSVRVREFGNIPIPIDSFDLSIDQSVKSKAATSVVLQEKTYDLSQSAKDNSKSTTSIVTQEKTYSVSNQQPNQENIFDNSCIKDALKSVKDVLYQYYDQGSHGNNLSGVEPIQENDSCKQEQEYLIEEVTGVEENSVHDRFKDVFAKVNKNETIAAQECSLIDICDEDLSRAEIKEHETLATPPKVIYSEPMKVAKPWTSMLDFTGGFSSGKKPYSFNSITSMDGTQQLIEATFSQPLREQTSDTSKHKSICRNLDPYSSVNKSTVKAQTILDNIHNRIVQYQRPQFDYEECSQLPREYKNLQDKVRRHLEEFQSPQPQNAILDAKVKRLSLPNTSYDSNSSNSILEGLDEDEDVVIEEIPETLHERILKVINDVEDHMLKLEYSEDNYYVCSTFARCTWFDVELHPEDGRVTDIKAHSNLKENPCKLYEFIVKHTLTKLQMGNLRSSLGSCFDMLSLLDHVNLITEKSFEFCIEFMNASRQYKTLKMEADATVSFQIIVASPPIWWEVEFVMASVENVRQDSLKATSKWGQINQEHLNSILRNTEPGLDCVRRFVGTVAEYFQRTQLSKFKLKDAHKLPE